MYIYKRPYVHFPTIFLRQNCDHMCIIKIVFNPLPMKIFWKKIALYIQFLKDKESALYFVEVSILYKHLCWPSYVQCWKLKWTCYFCQIYCRKDFFSRGLQNKINQSTILSIKFYSFVTHVMNLKIWHEVWGARSLSCWCWVILFLTQHSLSPFSVPLVHQHVPVSHGRVALSLLFLFVLPAWVS